MKQKRFGITPTILVVAAGSLVVGMFCAVAFQAFAFVGPSATPSTGNGAIGSDAANEISIGTSTPTSGTALLVVGSTTTSGSNALNIEKSNGTSIMLLRDDGSVSIETSTISAGNTIIGGSLTVGGTLTASNLGGGTTITAGNVSSGQFGSGTGGGGYEFPGYLSVGTTTNCGLFCVASSSVYFSVSSTSQLGFGGNTNWLQQLTSLGTVEFDTNDYLNATNTAAFGTASTTISISTTTGLAPSGYVEINNIEIASYASFTSAGASSTLNGMTRALFGTAAQLRTGTTTFVFYAVPFLVAPNTSNTPLYITSCQSIVSCASGFGIVPNTSVSPANFGTGININSATGKVDVNSQTTILGLNPGNIFTDGSTSGNVYIGANGAVTAASSTITLSSTTVSIGTSTLTTGVKLEVVGGGIGIAVSGPALGPDTGYGIKVYNNGGTVGYEMQGTSGVLDGIQDNNTNFLFADGTSTQPFDFTGANVGIGTTTPATDLNVVSATSTIRVGLGSNSNGTGCFESYDHTNTSTIWYSYGNSGVWVNTTTKPAWCE